jgi:hypothetical protein
MRFVNSALIHPSHDVRENGSERWPEGAFFAGQFIEYGVEPHTTGWYCARCGVYTCALCRDGEGIHDDDLKTECPGISWWDLPGRD